jgi:hypothetical protein
VALDTDVIVTAAKVYAPLAALRGGERFPKGAQLLLVHDLGARGTLLHNVSTDTGHWIAVKLVGTKSNRDGIGAGVEVDAAGKRWTAERVAGSGYLSQDDGRLHFGLSAATKVDKLIVRWPSGREQTLEKLAVDRVLKVEEPKWGIAKPIQGGGYCFPTHSPECVEWMGYGDLCSPIQSAESPEWMGHPACYGSEWERGCRCWPAL